MCILIEILPKFVPKGSIDSDSACGSDNGLAPNRRQVILWNNDDSVHWLIYASPGPNVLNYNTNMVLNLPNHFEITHFTHG